VRAELFIAIIFCLWLQTKAQDAIHQLPRIIKKENSFRLLVNNKSFLILGGELGNSSSTPSGWRNAFDFQWQE